MGLTYASTQWINLVRKGIVSANGFVWVCLSSPSKKILSQQKVYKLAELRRSRWKETHEATQQLAKLYWNFHVNESNSRDDMVQSRFDASTSLEMTTLPQVSAFLGLMQSFGPCIRSSMW